MINSIILGLIQGLTEFLPVSSSGHLIIVRAFLHLPLQSSLTFDVLLHLATALAVVIYFWGDIKRILVDFKTEGLSARSGKLLWAIIAGTIPAVILGYLYGDVLENYFRSPAYVAYALILGSILFILADNVHKILPQIYNQKGGISVLKGLVIGIFQSTALIPGMSRSGSSISGGILSKLSREESIRFAFLLSIPAILGAAAKTFLHIPLHAFFSEFFTLPVALGFITAFISGLFAIRFFVRYISNHSFTPFVIYRILLAIAVLIWL
jgi:undecaprenyl-diphosphatase